MLNTRLFTAALLIALAAAPLCATAYGYPRHFERRHPFAHYDFDHYDIDIAQAELEARHFEALTARREMNTLQNQLLKERTIARELRAQLATPRSTPTPPPPPPRTAPHTTVNHQARPATSAPSCQLCGLFWLLPLLFLLSSGSPCSSSGCSPLSVLARLAVLWASLNFIGHAVSFLLLVLALVLPYLLPLLPLLLLFSLPLLFREDRPQRPTPTVVTFVDTARPQPRAASASRPRAPPVPSGALLPAAPLSPGSRGPGVVQLQEVLINAGLMSRGAVRRGVGFFGPFTARAVALVQRDTLKVQPTGVYDEAVRAHLLSLLAQPSQEAPAQATAAAATQEAAPAPAPAAAPEPTTAPTTVPTPTPAVAPASDATSSEQAVTANPEAAEAAVDGRVRLLREMGFSPDQVQTALAATHGSLDRAADWLFVEEKSQEVPQEELPQEEEAFPEEWCATLAELLDMGFEEEAAKAAVQQTNADFKLSVKALLTQDRSSSA